MENIPTQITCSNCHVVMSGAAYFCSNCGKAVRKQPPSTSVSKQATIYSISLFLPPFGLWYTWRYFRQPDRKSKIIGVAAAVLTIVSVIITVWTTESLLGYINEQLNVYNGLF